MSAGYEALTTKVKAMYGKRLRYADFVRLSKLGSVSEIYADLRQHPVWGGAAARLTEEGKFGRARLEAALREQVREEYVRLTGFIPRKDRALMDFPVLRSELDGLLFTLTRFRPGASRRSSRCPPGSFCTPKLTSRPCRCAPTTTACWTPRRRASIMIRS